MKLEQKGAIQPPPALPGPAEATSQSVQSWPGMIAATHWDLYRSERVDGADFYVGELELGHLHLDGEVHLATSPELGAVLVSTGLARRFAYGGDPYEGWVETSVRTPADAAHATWLFRLNYDRLGVFRYPSYSPVSRIMEQRVLTMDPTMSDRRTKDTSPQS